MTTPIKNNDMRPSFEAWAREEGYSLKRDMGGSGPYTENDTQFAWNGYRAGYREHAGQSELLATVEAQT